ncbi:MAG: hypothetical protein JWM59_2092 [Verrucomicrobiales bacterium]|nr:hypothetical protein [Verrucomicrobiales bacterium]
MKTWPLFLFLTLSAIPFVHLSSHAVEVVDIKAKPMKIELKAGGKTVSATMRDSRTAQEFLALLPLTLDLSDYAGAEKISDLPKKLTQEGAPSGSDASAGDIAYYAPWGNLAIFYKNAPYAEGLIIIGRIDTGLHMLTELKQAKVVVGRAEP